MIDGFTEAQLIGAMFGVIGGLIVIMLAMVGAFATWVVRRFDQLEVKFDARIDTLDAKFTTKIDALDAKFTAKIDALDAKFTAKIDALTIAVSRLEGAVYHGLPEPRRAIQE